MSSAAVVIGGNFGALRVNPYILVYAEDEEVDQHPLLNIFLPHHQYISH